jgi:hypothetical protein
MDSPRGREGDGSAAAAAASRPGRSQRLLEPPLRELGVLLEERGDGAATRHAHAHDHHRGRRVGRRVGDSEESSSGDDSFVGEDERMGTAVAGTVKCLFSRRSTIHRAARQFSRSRSRDTISRQPNDAACVAITAATVDVSAVWRRVFAMLATSTHVIEVARNCAGCTSSTCAAALALRHDAAW